MNTYHIEVHFYLEVEAKTEDEAEEWGWAVQRIVHPQTGERLGPDHVSIFEPMTDETKTERMEELSDGN